MAARLRRTVLVLGAVALGLGCEAVDPGAIPAGRYEVVHTVMDGCGIVASVDPYAEPSDTYSAMLIWFEGGLYEVQPPPDTPVSTLFPMLPPVDRSRPIHDADETGDCPGNLVEVRLSPHVESYGRMTVDVSYRRVEVDCETGQRTECEIHHEWVYELLETCESLCITGSDSVRELCGCD